MVMEMFKKFLIVLLVLCSCAGYVFADGDTWDNIIVNSVHRDIIIVDSSHPVIGGVTSDTWNDTVTGNGSTDLGLLANPINLNGVVLYGDPINVRIEENWRNWTLDSFNLRAQFKINITSPSYNPSDRNTWLGVAGFNNANDYGWKYPGGWITWDSAGFNWNTSQMERVSTYQYVNKQGRSINLNHISTGTAIYNYDSSNPPNGLPDSTVSPKFVVDELGEWTVMAFTSFMRNGGSGNNGGVYFKFNVTLPEYDLKFNKPTGPVNINDWVSSTFNCVHNQSEGRVVSPWWGGTVDRTTGETLGADYYNIKVTYPSGKTVESNNIPFAKGVNSGSIGYQVTEKGQYKVEAWAYRANSTHVPVPQAFLSSVGEFLGFKKTDENTKPDGFVATVKEEFYVS